jgi:hypothetical protein
MSREALREALRVAARWLKRALNVGETFENEKWRVHRYADSIHATDLTNAGKRGAKVPVLVMRVVRQSDVPMESLAMEMTMNAKRMADFTRMKLVFDEAQEIFGNAVQISIEQSRGVDVAPGGFETLHVKGQHVEVEAGHKSFSVRDLDDKFNEPTAISTTGGLKGIPVFWRWVKDNEAALQHMVYRDVLKTLDSLGVKYHDYLAMD